MSNIPEVPVTYRSKTGKGETGRLRRSGKIPAVVYGLEGASSSITVEPKAVSKILNSEKGLNTVVNLRVGDSEETRHVMIKDMARHPVSGQLMHVDFLRVDMGKMIEADIPLEFVGSPEGVKLGGILNIVAHEIAVECVAKDLPAPIKIDVSHIQLDGALRVSDLPVLEGVKYLLEDDFALAVVHSPHQPEVEEDEESEEGAEEAAS